MLYHAHSLKSALFTLACTSALTGCLSVQIEGQVAGHDMGFIESSFAIQGPVVAMDPEAKAGGYQLLMSDGRVACTDAELLGEPNGDNHTLAITLKKADGSLPGEGLYTLGAPSDEDSAASTFVFTTGVTARYAYARAGEIMVETVLGDAVEGYFWLEFDQGGFEGVFSSAPCIP